MKAPEDIGTLEIEMRIEAPPDVVFAYFTEADRYRRWKGHRARLDPRPGGIYSIDLIGETGVRGTFVAIERPNRIVFTWGWEGATTLPEGIAEVAPGSSTVEVTLEPDGDATILRLRHTGLPTEASRTSHAWGWHAYLARLAIAASGGDPGVDPLAAILAAHPTRQPWLG